MLIHELIPDPDTATAQAVVVAAEPAATYAAIATTDLVASRLAQTLSPSSPGSMRQAS